MKWQLKRVKVCHGIIFICNVNKFQTSTDQKITPSSEPSELEKSSAAMAQTNNILEGESSISAPEPLVTTEIQLLASDMATEKSATLTQAMTDKSSSSQSQQQIVALNTTMTSTSTTNTNTSSSTTSATTTATGTTTTTTSTTTTVNIIQNFGKKNYKYDSFQNLSAVLCQHMRFHQIIISSKN
jgi:hypothetical protein